jgi:hypothetical protein
MKEYDVVELLQDNPKEGLVKGQKRTILIIYNDTDCEIEFCDDNGFTLYLGTMKMSNLRVV